MKIFLLFIVYSQLVKSGLSSKAKGYNIDAKLNTLYNGTVKDGVEDIYFFNLTNSVLQNNGGTVRIKVCSHDATADTPIFFVARLIKGVVSWSVPYNSGEKSYNYYTQTICRTIGGKSGFMESFYLDVSTLAEKGFSYSILAKNDSDYILRINKELEVSTTAAELLFFTYTFLPSDERVLVTAKSTDSICAVLIVQDRKQCASLTQANAVNSGIHATMTKKAGIVVEKAKLEKIYVVFMVKDSNTDCTTRKNSINPFPQTDAAQDKDHLIPLKSGVGGGKTSICNFTGDGFRNKTVKIKIVSLPKVKDYMEPVILPLIVYGSFYVISLIVMAVYWCSSDSGGKTFYTYLFPKKVKKENDEEDGNVDPQNIEELQETERLVHPRINQIVPTNSSGSTHSYNSINQHEQLSNPIGDGDIPPSPSDTDYDFLDDINTYKDVYRLNKSLMVSDTSRKSYKKLEKKFNIYYWNLMTVGIFYALPVVQLVLTYQRVTNESGDQDICYYNFFCARPYHIISAFNNVYSNIGYLLLGLLFVFFVMRRDRIAHQNYVKNPDSYQKYGLPKHYGIFYAMGWALFMEGIMSACYHVCPNYSNFQFDTAFMYILGILCSLRLYQARHHDVFINGHFAFAGFALVIFTAVIGVVYRSEGFFIAFCFFHILTCVYLALQMYYMGRAKNAMLVAWHSRGYNLFSKPFFPVRFVLLVVFVVVNAALSLYGASSEIKDFATFLLGIIICNGLFYVVFYCIMKFVCGEKIKVFPLLFGFASIATWGVAINFFVAGLTDWQTTAAQSREGNKVCIIADFYDDHDLWHFLSACALFFSFMCVLTIDDDLDKRERSTINVF